MFGASADLGSSIESTTEIDRDETPKLLNPAEYVDALN